MSDKLEFSKLIGLLEQTHNQLQKQASRSVDIALVVRNWLFGWYIVEYEQNGSDRAEYGSRFFEVLSKRLAEIKIKGSSPTRLKLYRSFYQKYKQIRPTVSVESQNVPEDNEIDIQQTPFDQLLLANFKQTNITHSLSVQLSSRFKLGWSHYVVFLTIDNHAERNFYEIEAIQNSWSVRELKRQIESSLYQRLALSRDKEKIKELSQKGLIIEKVDDIIKDPYVLEFLNLQEKHTYSEHELETTIIDKLEHFLLELGKGFLFEARQKRFTFDDDHFYVDLVFYNRLLRCYVLIDLKRDKLTHQDIGQMQMYVNYFDKFIKTEDEAPTVGIVLCHRKNEAMVELTLPENTNIHASQYQLYLPSKEELKTKLKQIEKELNNG